MLIFVLQWLFLHWEILIMLFSSCCWVSFYWLSIKLKMGCPDSSNSLWIFLCWKEWSSWSFERGWNWCISLIVSIRSSITQLHGFWLLVLEFAEITFFVCTKRINLLNLKESSESLVIIATGFLKLPNLHMLLKQKNLSLPGNLAPGTFGKSLLVFSAKVNLLYFISSTAQRCCLLHLLKTFLILMTQVSLYPFSFLELIWNCLFL